MALCGCETRTIGTEELRKLEAFEVWCYRKTRKVEWIERITNEEVFNGIKEKPLWNGVRVRRDKIIGHLLRHGSLTKSVVGQIV